MAPVLHANSQKSVRPGRRKGCTTDTEFSAPHFKWLVGARLACSCGLERLYCWNDHAFKRFDGITSIAVSCSTVSTFFLARRIVIDSTSSRAQVAKLFDEHRRLLRRRIRRHSRALGNRKLVGLTAIEITRIAGGTFDLN